MLTRWRAIFFDNDGVLVDTEGLYRQATREAMAAAGVSLTDELYHEYWLVGNSGAWHLAEKRGATPEDIARLKHQRNLRYAQLLQTEPIFVDGARETIEELTGRFTLGIVTASRKDHFDIIHARTGLLKRFDFVIAEGDFTHSKPHPEPYRLAIQRAGYAPAECLAVEDSERGLRAARAAGLDCVIITTPHTRSADLTGACAILESIRELPRWLECGPA